LDSLVELVTNFYMKAMTMILKHLQNSITAYDHVSSILGDMGGKPEGEVPSLPSCDECMVARP